MINHSKEYTVAALAAWAEFWLELWFFPDLKISGSFTCLLGGLFLVGGQACRIVAMHTARGHFSHTIMETRQKDHQLVTHGIYRFLRHPSYCGWFWWVVGTQILLCNPLCALVYALVSWRFFAARIKYEEGTLKTFYPQEYPSYCRQTVVGIPFIS
jgi:protein-S-isoprenylcysteine O-methyltransferase